jgi:hypothetical protein
MKDLFDAISPETKHAFDALSIIATLGALVNWLPALSAFLSCVWLVLRIYESETVQKLLKKKD